MIRPILSPPYSVNQRLPSGPAAIPSGSLPAVGIGNSGDFRRRGDPADRVAVELGEPEVAVRARRDPRGRRAGRELAHGRRSRRRQDGHAGAARRHGDIEHRVERGDCAGQLIAFLTPDQRVRPRGRTSDRCPAEQPLHAGGSRARGVKNRLATRPVSPLLALTGDLISPPRGPRHGWRDRRRRGRPCENPPDVAGVVLREPDVPVGPGRDPERISERGRDLVLGDLPRRGDPANLMGGIFGEPEIAVGPRHDPLGIS